ncbi:MAG: UDP-N-acetylmuramoyl-L-alanyl-D-glutamate--2,6-diaminopimelate ligase [Elusimicrobiota bacterium]
MRLNELFGSYRPSATDGDMDIEITGIAADSNRVEAGGLFFALKGEKADGADYIEDAVKNGALAVVTEKKVNVPGTAVVYVEDSRHALSEWSSVFYGCPSDSMTITGVTGTNGKTTITNIIYQMLSEEGAAGLIGTSGYFYGSKKGSFGLTTPLANDLHFIFSVMASAGVDKVAMEVSSHALVLKRVENVKFEKAIFTNLTQDHLDFHRSLEEYYLSKLRLFGLLRKKEKGAAVINVDDVYGVRMCRDIGFQPVTYAIENKADYMAEIIDINMKGSTFNLITPQGSSEVSAGLIGKFNVYNCLAAAAWAMEGGRNMENICKAISRAVPVPGRCEILSKEDGSDRFVVIDYAHTPVALENILMTLRRMVNGRLICVFGCGGDRDREKRPLMGKVAGILSDKVYLTSDNPRSEESMSIILDIEVGIRDTATPYEVEEDREEAIRKAIKNANESDCILIAGKGDEEYQIIGEQKIFFSDRMVAKSYI